MEFSQRGRPRSYAKGKKVLLRMEERLYALLEAQAKAEGISTTKLIQRDLATVALKTREAREALAALKQIEE